MEDIFVGRLLTSPVETVDADTSLQEAATVMIENKIGSVVVVDGDDRLAGILTATDFVALASEGGAEEGTTVADRMSTEVVTTTANESIRNVADTMLERGFHHVPVVDEDEAVVGIITTTDLTAYLSNIRPAGL